MWILLAGGLGRKMSDVACREKSRGIHIHHCPRIRRGEAENSPEREWHARRMASGGTWKARQKSQDFILFYFIFSRQIELMLKWLSCAEEPARSADRTQEDGDRARVLTWHGGGGPTGALEFGGFQAFGRLRFPFDFFEISSHLPEIHATRVVPFCCLVSLSVWSPWKCARVRASITGSQAVGRPIYAGLLFGSTVWWRWAFFFLP